MPSEFFPHKDFYCPPKSRDTNGLGWSMGVGSAGTGKVVSPNFII